MLLCQLDRERAGEEKDCEEPDLAQSTIPEVHEPGDLFEKRMSSKLPTSPAVIQTATPTAAVASVTFATSTK